MVILCYVLGAMSHQILLYYKYTPIEDPKALRDSQRALCEQLGLKGRIIVAEEGINGTVEGTVENTEKYIEAMKQDDRFADMNWKKSPGPGSSFPKLSVKVRSEIVSLGLGQEDIKPWEGTGKYLEADELKQWFENEKNGEDFVIIDMRNDYEYKSGHFKDSVLPPLKNFRDLPKILPELEKYKDKKVLPVCTGGVRCEKASAFLMKNGFKNVYQLHNGIVTYMEKYPNKDFLGKLYVFDGRHTMGFNVDDPDHVVVGKCDVCQKPCDNYADCAYPRCNRHFIACEDCRESDGKAFCSDNCRQEVLINLNNS